MLLCSVPSFAAFTGPGDNGVGANSPISKADQVASAVEDAPCLLEGNVIEQVQGRKDWYTFKDETGTVTIKIGRKQLRYRDITPQTKVRICGEVDIKKDNPTLRKIDVDWLEILQ